MSHFLKICPYLHARSHATLRGYMFLSAINGMPQHFEGGIFSSASLRNAARKQAGLKGGLADVEDFVAVHHGVLLVYNPHKGLRTISPRMQKQQAVASGTYFHIQFNMEGVRVRPKKGQCTGSLQLAKLR